MSYPTRWNEMKPSKGDVAEVTSPRKRGETIAGEEWIGHDRLSSDLTSGKAVPILRRIVPSSRHVFRAPSHFRPAFLLAFVPLYLCAISAFLVPVFAQSELPVGASDTVTDFEFQIPVNEGTSAEIDALIVRLGSPNFEERENATSRLMELGVSAFRKLREEYRSTSDFEVRSRIEAVVEDSYMEYHIYGHFGYLGIAQNRFTPGFDDDPRIPVGHVGVKVERVMQGTGAERAGLRAEDVIITMDGQPNPGAGQRALDAFSAAIRSRGPGTQVRLVVLREAETFTTDAILTRPPRNPTENRNIMKFPEIKARAKARFAIWWPKYFLEASSQSTGQTSDHP